MTEQDALYNTFQGDENCFSALDRKYCHEFARAGTRAIETVAVLFGWLDFIVLYLAFFAGSFDFWQKSFDAVTPNRELG